MQRSWTKSLRLRLVTGIILTLMVSWLVQFSLHWADVVRENTGVRDKDLMNAAQVALVSVAAVRAPCNNQDAHALLQRRWVEASARHALLVFDMASGRRLFSSLDAPAAAIADPGKTGTSTRYVDGEGWRVYSAVDTESALQVVVASPLSRYDQQFTERLILGSIVTLIMFLMLAGVSLLVSSLALRPVSRLTSILRKRHVTDISPLCEKQVPTEIQPLIRAFNQQHARLRDMIDNERNFLSNAAHELRTPLAVLTVQTENALRTDDIDEIKALLRKMAATTQRSSRLAEQLLDLARLESGDAAAPMSRVDLAEVVQLVCQELDMTAQERHQKIVLDLDPCVVTGHVDSLGILTRNLLDNACRYSGTASSVLVQCKHDTNGVELIVMDDGPGVPLEEREKIFDRFYRVPGTVEQGSGIGLALVWRIAKQHQAAVSVSPGIGGRGVGFRVRFAHPAVQHDSP